MLAASISNDQEITKMVKKENYQDDENQSKRSSIDTSLWATISDVGLFGYTFFTNEEGYASLVPGSTGDVYTNP